MAQIKKDKKQSDNQRISSLTLENDTLLQSTEVDQLRKDQAKAVVNFALQVINSEDFKGRDLRIYNLGIQEAVNKILKGEQGYSDSMTGDAKTNIFGYYSKKGQPSELDWMINETVKRGSNGNVQTSQNTPTVSTPMKQIVTLTPASGFSSYVLPSTTVDLKVKKFAQHLSGQLNNYLNNPYDESLYIIKGINKDSILNFLNYVDSLSSLSGREATAEDILALGDIVSALGNEDLTNAFEQYFAKELAGTEEKPKETVQPVETPKASVSPELQTTLENKQESETPQISNEITELLSNIKDLTNIPLIGTLNFTKNPFKDPTLIKDFIYVDGLDFDKSFQEFIKLYLLAENGNKTSLNTIKNKFKRTLEKHGITSTAAGDQIIQELRADERYKSIIKYCFLNSLDETEKEILLKELLKPRDSKLKRVLTDSLTTPTYFSSSLLQQYPLSRRTYSEKQGGKLDKLQNYINNKNGK